jgi:hypothetical protein
MVPVPSPDQFRCESGVCGGVGYSGFASYVMREETCAIAAAPQYCLIIAGLIGTEATALASSAASLKATTTPPLARPVSRGQRLLTESAESDALPSTQSRA